MLNSKIQSLCKDYIDEDFPEECVELRAGRPAYTCLKVDTQEGQVSVII